MIFRRAARLALILCVSSGVFVYARQTKDQELRDIQKRAEDILKKNEILELTMAEARKKVQQILKDLKSWAESHDVELSTRERTFANPAVPEDEILSTDACALFFEDNELCPLDLAHSEVWGQEVIRCRYLCAVSAEEE